MLIGVLEMRNYCTHWITDKKTTIAAATWAFSLHMIGAGARMTSGSIPIRKSKNSTVTITDGTSQRMVLTGQKLPSPVE